jgi:hypothetical protein
LRKIGKPLKKLESRFRKRKAVEEIGKPLKKSETVEEDFLGFLGNWKAVEEN